MHEIVINRKEIKVVIHFFVKKTYIAFITPLKFKINYAQSFSKKKNEAVLRIKKNLYLEKSLDKINISKFR